MHTSDSVALTNTLSTHSHTLSLSLLSLYTLSLYSLSLLPASPWPNTEDFPKEHHLNHIKRSTYAAVQSFVGNNDHTLKPKTSAGRIAILASCFAVLVTSNTYQANLTVNTITNQEGEAPYADLEQVVKTRTKICGISILRDLLATTYPGIEDLFVVSETGSAAQDFANMDAGLCKVVVTEIDAWNLEKKKASNCNKMKNAQVLRSIEVAFGVSQELQAAMSWLVTKSVAAGMYINAEKEAMFANPVADECEGTEKVSLIMSNIEGPCLFSLLGCCFALVIYGVGYLRHAEKKDDEPHHAAKKDSESP